MRCLKSLRRRGKRVEETTKTDRGLMSGSHAAAALLLFLSCLQGMDSDDQKPTSK